MGKVKVKVMACIRRQVRHQNRLPFIGVHGVPWAPRLPTIGAPWVPMGPLEPTTMGPYFQDRLPKESEGIPRNHTASDSSNPRRAGEREVGRRGRGNR